MYPPPMNGGGLEVKECSRTGWTFRESFLSVSMVTVVPFSPRPFQYTVFPSETSSVLLVRISKARIGPTRVPVLGRFLGSHG